MNAAVGPFFDLQVNGYAGVDFNSDELSAESLRAACERLGEDGVAGALATIISAPLDRMLARLARLATLRAADPLVAERIAGIHIEGPFLNEQPGYVGAHPVAAMRWADADTMRRLLDAACGLTKLVTLAPERDPRGEVTALLSRSGVIVAAGHTDASLDELKAALDAGLSAFTHLGNGCPQHLPRHDNIVQRALSLRERLNICFIADGVHIPPPALGNYLRLVGADRAIVVTDAIAAARLGPGRYMLGEQTVNVGADLVCRSTDGEHFVGSTATMPRMARLLSDQLGFSPSDIRQLLWDNPRRLLATTSKSIVGG